MDTLRFLAHVIRHVIDRKGHKISKLNF